jgi:ribonuclease P protein component
MKGKRLSLDGLSLFYTKNTFDNFRVGISVSKKQAKAAKRNKLRRQIRECAKRVLNNYALGYDLVFVARQKLCSADFHQIFQIVETVLKKTALRGTKSEGMTT